MDFGQTLDRILCSENEDFAFADDEGIFFSQNSKADIFEVFGDEGGEVQRGLDDHAISKYFSQYQRSTKQPRLRVMFIDGIKDDPNRLPVTSHTLKSIFETLEVNPRFAGFLSRQEVAGRSIKYESGTQLPQSYELWYSAVIRSLYEHGDRAPDLSRKVLDWQSFCLWSNYTLSTKSTTILIFRCPEELKERFYRRFKGPTGKCLQTHPMVLHAYLTENLIRHTYFFLQKFSEPLYAWENKAFELQTSEDYTRRSQSFLSLARQIQQVATDYDILVGSVEQLQKATTWFEQAEVNPGLQNNQGPVIESRATGLFQDHFDRCFKEIGLIRTYNALYAERTQIGVNECFALVNQRDAEVNIKMAVESTEIARTSHQDNRSLRIIQIMSMIFLPSSLVSSVFGMGFFNTSTNDKGTPVFSVSDKWWIYFAVSVPLTVFVLSFMQCYQWRGKKKNMCRKVDEESLFGGVKGKVLS